MTKIFNSYSEFLDREDTAVNGVSPEFAKEHPNWERMNTTNKGCWNCRSCSDCRDCSSCSSCSDCHSCRSCRSCSEKTGGINSLMNIPKIENIHQAVYAAANQPAALNMDSWHTCETTHCRAGWVTHLAGEAGRALEKQTSTLFAAMQIYKVSSDIRVSPTIFFESNEKALEDMRLCAEKEQAQPTPSE